MGDELTMAQIDFREFHKFMPSAAAKLGLSSIPDWAWETHLPYGRDWGRQTHKRREKARDAGWFFGKDEWDAMPWGDDAGLWQWTTKGIVWLFWARGGITGLPAKPTWEQVFPLLRIARIDHEVERGQGTTRLALNAAKSGVANIPVKHPQSETPLDVGRGIEHMPALMHHIDQAAFAGRTWPPATMRDKDGNTIDLWTIDSAHDLLGPLAAARNSAESAYNVLKKSVAELQKIVADENGGLPPSATADEKLDARDAARKSVADIRENADKYLADELARHQKRVANGPADLPTLKKNLCERLEARTMAKTKALMKAATQQGIDRGFSCADEERAVKEAARECVLGSLEIKAAQDEVYTRKSGKWGLVTNPANLPDTEHHSGIGKPGTSTGADNEHYRRTGSGIAAAKAAFAAAVKKIDAITALNVPVWKIGSAQFPRPGGSHAITGREVVVDAIQPAVSPPVAGRVTIAAFVKALYADGKEVGGIRVVHGSVPGDATAARARVRLPAGETKPVTIAASAQNLCGPTSISITVTPTSEPR